MFCKTHVCTSGFLARLLAGYLGNPAPWTERSSADRQKNVVSGGGSQDNFLPKVFRPAPSCPKDAPKVPDRCTDEQNGDSKSSRQQIAGGLEQVASRQKERALEVAAM